LLLSLQVPLGRGAQLPPSPLRAFDPTNALLNVNPLHRTNSHNTLTRAPQPDSSPCFHVLKSPCHWLHRTGSLGQSAGAELNPASAYDAGSASKWRKHAPCAEPPCTLHRPAWRSLESSSRPQSHWPNREDRNLEDRWL